MFASFAGHAELAGVDAGVYVLGSVSRDGDFEIVDERSTIHGDAGYKSAFHQIDEDRAEADFDDVAADAPQNCFFVGAGALDSSEQLAEIFSGEKIGE